MQQQTTAVQTGGVTTETVEVLTAMAERDRERLKALPSPYLRMTPEILAELAFQQAAIMASRLPCNRADQFWQRLGKYVTQMQTQNEVTVSISRR